MPPKSKTETQAPGADQVQATSQQQETGQPPAADSAPVEAPVLDPVESQGITLHIAHPVKHDGTVYGPGDVTVSAELAEVFRGLGIVTE